MKIALVIDNFSPTKGGGEGYAAHFAQLLMEHGHEVHIFTRSGGNVIPPLILHSVPSIRGSELVQVLSFGYYSRKMLQRASFDIIQGFGKSSWYMDVFRPGGGVHRAYLQQNFLSMDNRYYRNYRRLLRAISLKDLIFGTIERYQYEQWGIKRIIINSELAKGHIERFYQYPSDQIRVIFNGVDLKKFQPKNDKRKAISRDNDLILLFVAHNFRLKGLACLINALGALIKAEPRLKVKLIIAGRGKRYPYLKQAQQLGCADKLVFLGQVEEMALWYQSADILIHPTFYDPNANVCWEAAACGLPIITTHFNGFSELMANGLEDYILPDPRDTIKLKDIILSLSSPAQRIEVGEKVRTLVEKYPLERNYQEIIQVYQEIAG
jgi:UDP-glucose:(heptosyl)LPS alpha-1,3-glucosyltransferase